MKSLLLKNSLMASSQVWSKEKKLKHKETKENTERHCHEVLQCTVQDVVKIKKRYVCQTGHAFTFVKSVLSEHGELLVPQQFSYGGKIINNGHKNNDKWIRQ